MKSYTTGAVYSAKCLHDVDATPGTEAIKLCSACYDILHLHTFQTRINIPMPVEEDMCFAPEGYCCMELGNIYLKYKGMHELVEKV